MKEFFPEHAIDSVLDNINTEFGNNYPIRKKYPSYDTPGFHFEFGVIFGLAYENNPKKKPRVFLLINEENKWHINPGENKLEWIHPTWLQDQQDVTNRMIDYINKNNPDTIEQITL